MTLKEYLFLRFKGHYKGKNSSITRKRLIGIINSSSILNGYLFGNFTDRETRRAYEDLPICGGSKGLYLLETEEERQEQIKLHWSKIYAYFRKIDVLENYKIESDPTQKDLF